MKIKDRLPPGFVVVITLAWAAFGFGLLWGSDDWYLAHLAPFLALCGVLATFLMWGILHTMEWAFPTDRWSDLWHGKERRAEKARRNPQGRSIGFICDSCHKWCFIPVPEARAKGLLVEQDGRDICSSCAKGGA